MTTLSAAGPLPKSMILGPELAAEPVNRNQNDTDRPLLKLEKLTDVVVCR